MFFLRDKWIKKQRIKIKNTGKIGDALQFYLKSIFKSFIFFSY